MSKLPSLVGPTDLSSFPCHFQVSVRINKRMLRRVWPVVVPRLIICCRSWDHTDSRFRDHLKGAVWGGILVCPCLRLDSMLPDNSDCGIKAKQNEYRWYAKMLVPEVPPFQFTSRNQGLSFRLQRHCWVLVHWIWFLSDAFSQLLVEQMLFTVCWLRPKKLVRDREAELPLKSWAGILYLQLIMCSQVSQQTRCKTSPGWASSYSSNSAGNLTCHCVYYRVQCCVPLLTESVPGQQRLIGHENDFATGPFSIKCLKVWSILSIMRRL